MTATPADLLALVRQYGDAIDKALRCVPGSAEEGYWITQAANAYAALVNSDPLWQEWLDCPPRTELKRQHELAVQLQRKYRCDYARLSHSMRSVWCDHWEAKLGRAPYSGAWEGVG